MCALYWNCKLPITRQKKYKFIIFYSNCTNSVCVPNEIDIVV